MSFLPQTKYGKWAVGLHTIFIVVVGFILILTLGLGLLNFGARWWDVLVPILLVINLLALIFALLARIKFQDTSKSLTLSIVLGIAVILFVLTHSLFIHD